MPRVNIKLDHPDGTTEIISEYLCDWPDCPNVAEHALGVVRSIGLSAAVCDEHHQVIQKKKTEGK